MKQFFQKRPRPNQLVVAFRGTGSNEYQLLATITTLYPGASVLSYLGAEDVSEQQHFFAPLVNGALSRVNSDERAMALLEEVWQSQKSYDEVIFIGYSNGASFILGLLEKSPTIINTVILLHPSNLGYQCISGELTTKVVVTTEVQDESSIPGQILSLANQLKKHFPVDLLLIGGDHGLSEEEITRIKGAL